MSTTGLLPEVEAAPLHAPTRRWIGRLRDLLSGLLPRGAIVLTILTLAGYVMGLVRDRAFARAFGAGGDLDAYNAAFVLPELALDVLVAGGLAAPFVPLFTGLRAHANEDARVFGQTILTYAVLVMGIASAVLFVFAPETVGLIVPGFHDERRDLYINLFRLMCLSPLIFAASIVLGEVLVAERRFVWFGLAPLCYNGGIVAGTILFADRLGIFAAAFGALAGALAHLAVRLIGISRTSFRPVPRFNLRTNGLGEFARLMVPKMVSHPIEPLTFLFFTALASTLEPGSVSSLSYARNFASVPVSLIGASFAIAAFPTLSAQFASGDRNGFTRTFGLGMVSIAGITIVGAIVLFFVSEIAIRILLGGGAFDELAIMRTSSILAVFALAVPFESATHMLSRALYATHNTLLPSAASVIGFVVTVAVAQALAPSAGLAAIPFSFAAGMVTKVGLLALALAPRIARIGRSGETARRPTRRSGIRGAPLGLAVILVAGTLFAANQTLIGGATLAQVPDVTPWARVNPPKSPSAPPAGSPAASLPAGVAPDKPSPIPSPTTRPGPFSMDLYEEGDNVGEFENTWCLAAAMQTSMNIMDVGADTTRKTQARVGQLARSLGGIAPGGGAEPEGWALGLTQLGYGDYEVAVEPTLKAAIHLAARQIRLTNRPVGLLTWRGIHSWVMSGFTATADPAGTDAFTVTSVRIEDPWYPRHSTIWGYSTPPDATIKVSDLHIDYLPWRLWRKAYPDKDGQFVLVIPTQHVEQTRRGSD